MRWPWQRRSHDSRADKALATSHEQRVAAERQRGEVSRLAELMRSIREEDNLAARVRDALGEGR